MSLLRISLALVTAFALSACGAQHEDKRSADGADAVLNSGDATAKTPTTAAPDATTPAPIVPAGEEPAADVGSDVLIAPNSVEVVDEVNRTYDSYFFQSYGSLADLFATGDTSGPSMLCFPSALAYHAEYRRGHAQVATPQIFDATSAVPNSAANAAADVRALADVCATDLKKGMTVPEGVACIDRLYAKTTLNAKIQVIGQDAQWATFGMFPKQAVTEIRTVTPVDLRSALGRDASVIALVGAYAPGDGTSLKRVKGHFVSLTGYSHRASFGADRQELVIVDPSVDYRNRPAGQRFDRAVMAPAPTTLTGMLPQHAGFELRGLDIGAPSGSTVVIESIIVFE